MFLSFDVLEPNTCHVCRSPKEIEHHVSCHDEEMSYCQVVCRHCWLTWWQFYWSSETDSIADEEIDVEVVVAWPRLVHSFRLRSERADWASPFPDRRSRVSLRFDWVASRLIGEERQTYCDEKGARRSLVWIERNDTVVFVWRQVNWTHLPLHCCRWSMIFTGCHQLLGAARICSKE